MLVRSKVKFVLIVALISFFFLILAQTTFGATRTWDGGGTDGTCGNGAGDGNKWSCVLNWSDDSIPGSGDIALFNSTSIKDATIDTSYGGTVGGINIASGYDGTITQARSLTTTSSGFTQADGVFVGGSQDIAVVNTFTLSGGDFTSTSGTMTVIIDFTISGTPQFNANGGTIRFHAAADSTLACGGVTFSTITFAKPGPTQTINVGSDCTIPLGNSPTSTGTIVNNGGTITVGTGTWTLQSYTQTSGTLTMTGTVMDLNNHLTLTSGVFPAGLATLTVGGNLDNTGNLLPDSIDVTFDTAGDTTLDCGDAEFESFTLNKTASLIISSDCTITGDFTRTDAIVNNPAVARTFFVGGSFSMSTTDTFAGSNLTIEMDGGSDTTITQNAGTFSAKLKINKTVGKKVTQTTDLVLGGTLEVESGTYDQGATFALTTGGATTIDASGTWLNTGTGDITLAGDISNSGVITLDGSGSGCGGTNEIVILSSASPTQRTWSGAGTFTIYDVNASDQAGSITARSSDDTSNNDWTFLACNNSPSDPTFLAPASYVDGSWDNDNTPTLTFTLSDTDGSDTVKYTIQIDDTSNFSSLVVDYTSALAAQGAGSFTFTVGQVVGGGTYTTGTGGQTLSDSAEYYWRVKAIDNSSAESSYSTANSGAIAFKIDTTAPTAGTASLSGITTSAITVSIAGASDALSGLATTPYLFQNITNSTDSGQTALTSWDSTSLTSGTNYSFSVVVSDEAGNTSTTATVSDLTSSPAASNPTSSGGSSSRQFKMLPLYVVAPILPLSAYFPISPPFLVEPEVNEPTGSPPSPSEESEILLPTPTSIGIGERECRAQEKSDIRRLIRAYFNEAKDEIMEDWRAEIDIALLEYKQARLDIDKVPKAIAKEEYNNRKNTAIEERKERLIYAKEARDSTLEQVNENCITPFPIYDPLPPEEVIEEEFPVVTEYPVEAGIEIPETDGIVESVIRVAIDVSNTLEVSYYRSASPSFVLFSSNLLDSAREVSTVIVREVLPPSLIVGAFSGGLIAIAETVSVPSAFSFANLLQRLNIIGIFLGWRRRRYSWGTVYDSITKQPLDPAMVTLIDRNGQEVTSAVTDLDGRYGFLVKPGEYKIKVEKTNYQFPSRRLMGKVSDLIYGNLYFMDSFLVEQNKPVVNKDIPMDPIFLDWNEAQKSTLGLSSFYSRNSILMNKINRWVAIIGTLLSLGLFGTNPSTLNLVILLGYVLVSIFYLFSKPQVYGKTMDKKGGPLQFAMVRVYQASTNVEVRHTITDHLGRYFCLIPNGGYYIKIEERTGPESFEPVFTSAIFRVTKGVLDRVFMV